MQFYGCLAIANAAKGKTAVCDRETFGCVGGGVGLGFGEQYENFPGGEECFCHFLSSGNKSWEKGRQVSDQVKPFLRKESYDDFVNVEGCLKSPDKIKKFIRCLPMIDIPAEFVIFKPLSYVNLDNETPLSVTFFVDPDPLSALTALANYNRGDNENVIMPYAVGCQSIGLYSYRDAKSDRARAVTGLTDLSARVHIRRMLADNLMTFTAPFSLFKEMENSFLRRPVWSKLVEGK